MKLGILQLDTRFERLSGDAGHAATWPFEMVIRILRGLTPDAVMRDTGDSDAVLNIILDAVQALADDGADLITTTCGFLVVKQNEVSARCPVPFISSSLLQIPWLQAMLPASKTIGVLASNARALSDAHWRGAGLAAGAEQRLHVAGFDAQSHFIRIMRGQDTQADLPRLQEEVLGVAQQLVQQHPDVGAIVSECANLPRYAALIREQTGRAVFDLRTLVLWQASGLGLYAQAFS